MNAKTTMTAVTGVLLLAAVAGLVLQGRQIARLRSEVEEARKTDALVGELRSRNERLKLVARASADAVSTAMNALERLRAAQTVERDLVAAKAQPAVPVERVVSVIGAVGKPGAIRLPADNGLTLSRAISLASGPNRFADRKSISLTRLLPDGTTSTRIVNLDEIVKGDSRETWPLQPGDVVFVPERLL